MHEKTEYQTKRDLRDFIQAKRFLKMEVGFSLRETPITSYHVYYNDMKITFYLDLGKGNSIDVSYDLVKCWNVSIEELIKAALENEELVIMPLVEKAKEIAPEAEIPDNDMTYVSNKKGINGAVALFDLDFWKEVSKTHESFYILPCSVHELLLVSQGKSPEYWEEVVRYTNKYGGFDSDLLSNHVYTYDQEHNTICNADGSSDMKRDLRFGEKGKIVFSDTYESFL